MESLFVSAPQFEKSAGQVALPEDPNRWPVEILQELYKQVPYISDFSPHVIMDRVDAERGYAVGRVEVSNKSDIPEHASPDALKAAGLRSVRIPIVVREGKLQSFDLLVTAESDIFPLTDRRLRQALFRPQMFDVAAKGPGDQSMISKLYPPYRQGGGAGGVGGNVSMGSGMKEASARMSLLGTALRTATKTDYEKLASRMADREVVDLWSEHRATLAPVEEVLRLHSPDTGFAEKVAAAIPHMLRADVLQVIREEPGIYRVKTANADYYEPVEQLMSRGDVYARFGNKIALAADTEGAVTAVANPEDAEVTPAGQFAKITSYGIYKVVSDSGEEMVGAVVPGLLDLDGSALPITLFVNDEKVCVQTDIAGSLEATGRLQLRWGNQPQGAGCFVRMSANGSIEATIPLEVESSFQDDGEVAYMTHAFDGRSVQLYIQRGIDQITMLEDEGKVLVPTSFRWASFEGLAPTTLTGDEEDAEKMAAANTGDAERSVYLRGTGSDSFTLVGRPVEKIASLRTDVLSRDEAMFVLGALGVSPLRAAEKLAHAYTHSSVVQVVVARELGSVDEHRSAIKTAALATVGALPDFRRDLVKEAASIPDAMAVDTVLSLGLINPENLTSFIDALPTLEDAQKHVGDLLFASRLGLKGVPEVALERVLKSLEDVIVGLQEIAFREGA